VIPLSLISIEAARRRLEAAVRPIERVERVALAAAAGRVAAADVASPLAVPPFARAVMDGYAVVAADTTDADADHAVRLRIIERIHTGQMPGRRIEPGTCAAIATGAPLPDGADAVVMIERTRRVDDDAVDVLAAVAAGRDIGAAGSDIARGDMVVRKGDLLTPGRVGALAAIGQPEADVYARPRVAVLSTGPEVVVPGAVREGASVYDVNRFTLAAVIEANGGVPDVRVGDVRGGDVRRGDVRGGVVSGAVPDEAEALALAIDDCAGADVIVCSGGSSVGERDVVAEAVAMRGEMIFHGIAVKPGKPTAFARIGGAAFFGMPGNPTSCLSNACILLAPFLRATARLPAQAPRTIRLPLGRRIVSAAGRHQFYTVRIQDDAAFPAFKGSGAITSLSQADGYIEIPADRGTVEEGTPVDVVLF
jgi:molybdopterin molybdotransferase